VAGVRAIGFWIDDDRPDLPDPVAFIDAEWELDEREAVASYLSGGRPIDAGTRCSPCRVCGASTHCRPRALPLRSQWSTEPGGPTRMTFDGRLILIRHGETEWARLGKHTGRTDIELTDQGREEAVAARATLEDLQITAVFSSPLRRARETAEIVGLEPAIAFDDRLLEWDYGPAEGQRSVDMREHTDGWSVWTHPDTTSETADDVGNRVDEFIADALAGLPGDVAVFAHGHLLAVFIARWLQLAAVEGRRFKLDTATVSLLDFHREDRVIRALNHRCGDRL
jgi:probable phosphoglycerate mutase